MSKSFSFKSSALLLVILILSGCATLNIPAPGIPPKTLPEPPVEKSTITIPVTASLDSILGDLGLSSSSANEKDARREGIITGKIRRFLDRQASRNDKLLLNNRYVRGFAARAWDALQRPIPLDKGLSLLVNPEEVSLSPLPGEGNTVKFVVGLLAKPKIISGQESQPQPLPAISLSPAPRETGFHINLESELPFDMLGRELTKRFEGRTYTGHGESVMIEKVTLYGSGDSVVMAIHIKGTVKGTLFLSGLPEYDPTTNALSLGNVDYTLETKQVLAKAADWLMHTELRDSLSKRAKWSIGDRIDTARDNLSKALNRNLNQDVSIKGKIAAIRLVSIGITATGVKAVFAGDGTVEMYVSN